MHSMGWWVYLAHNSPKYYIGDSRKTVSPSVEPNEMRLAGSKLCIRDMLKGFVSLVHISLPTFQESRPNLTRKFTRVRL